MDIRTWNLQYPDTWLTVLLNSKIGSAGQCMHTVLILFENNLLHCKIQLHIGKCVKELRFRNPCAVFHETAQN